MLIEHCPVPIHDSLSFCPSLQPTLPNQNQSPKRRAPTKARNPDLPSRRDIPPQPISLRLSAARPPAHVESRSDKTRQDPNRSQLPCTNAMPCDYYRRPCIDPPCVEPRLGRRVFLRDFHWSLHVPGILPHIFLRRSQSMVNWASSLSALGMRGRDGWDGHGILEMAMPGCDRGTGIASAEGGLGCFLSEYYSG